MKLLALLLVTSLSTATASAGELIVGHVHLTLGMSKDVALAALQKEFEPKQVSVSEGKYLLWTKYRAGEGPRSAGSVSFANGKLYRATKNWSDELASDETKMAALFSALSEVTGSAGRSGRVRARTLRAEPSGSASGSEVKLITIEIPPDRVVLVQMTRDLPAPNQRPFMPTTSVQEVLLALPSSN